MQPSELPGAIAARTLQQLRQQAPLVHCLTNDVVQTLIANTLLALGASPAMVVKLEEAAQFSAIADALLINIGTLCQQRAAALPGERLDNVAGACRLMARAGRLTAAWAAGPGSFSSGMLDELYRLCAEDVQ